MRDHLMGWAGAAVQVAQAMPLVERLPAGVGILRETPEQKAFRTEKRPFPDGTISANPKAKKTYRSMDQVFDEELAKKVVSEKKAASQLDELFYPNADAKSIKDERNWVSYRKSVLVDGGKSLYEFRSPPRVGWYLVHIPTFFGCDPDNIYECHWDGWHWSVPSVVRIDELPGGGSIQAFRGQSNDTRNRVMRHDDRMRTDSRYKKFTEVLRWFEYHSGTVTAEEPGVCLVTEQMTSSQVRNPSNYVKTHDAKPPHVGWFPAVVNVELNGGGFERYWDGKRWTRTVMLETYGLKPDELVGVNHKDGRRVMASELARGKMSAFASSSHQDQISWCRVPA